VSSNRKMKYMYLTHGAGQGDLWSRIVLRCLDHATLEYIQVFERGCVHDRTLEAQVKINATKATKHIRVEGVGDVDGVFALVLNHLTDHTVVNDLILRSSRRGVTSLPDSLFAFLESSTTQISRLNLSGFHINKEKLTYLRRSIRSKYCHSLLLSGCSFHDDATADFVQTIGSVVRLLCLYSEFGGLNVFGQRPLETIYAELLVAKDTPLEYLRINGLRSEAAGRVFRGLATSRSTDVQVQRLYLDYVRPEEIAGMGTLLPNFTKLYALTIDGNTSGSVSTILNAFRQNGSLVEVKMGRDSGATSDEKRMLDAYCCRNLQGAKILHKVEDDNSLLLLVPLLFRLAQHSSRMGPNVILYGLLASAKSIPGHNIKLAGLPNQSASPSKNATGVTFFAKWLGVTFLFLYLPLTFLCAFADRSSWKLIPTNGECWSEGGSMPYLNYGLLVGFAMGFGLIGLVVATARAAIAVAKRK
jgi:hypothetical protein